MRSQKTHDGVKKHSMRSDAEHGKKQYRSPHLMEYGDISRLTAAKGGKDNDGGGHPSTKLA